MYLNVHIRIRILYIRMTSKSTFLILPTNNGKLLLYHNGLVASDVSYTYVVSLDIVNVGAETGTPNAQGRHLTFMHSLSICLSAARSISIPSQFYSIF